MRAAAQLSLSLTLAAALILLAGCPEAKEDYKSQKPPELEEICTLSTCPDCDGRGWSFRTVVWACRSCLGLGQKIAPKADPAKLLP